MTEKRKLLFVNDEMEMGGVARVLNTLMLNLDTNKYDIYLLVLHKRGLLLSEIPSHVKVIYGTPFFRTVDESLNQLIKDKNIPAILSKARLLFYMKTGLIKKKIIKERKKILPMTFDVEVAAKEGFCTIFTAYGDSKRKVNWVLTDYSVCNYSEHHMGLMKRVLEYIDLNIADSKQALKAYMDVFGVSKGLALHNLMDVNKVVNALDGELHLRDDDDLKIIDVARFHPQKSIDRLIKAHKYVLDKGIHHTLYLVGGGEEEEMLRELVKELNVEESVVFLGFQKNPYRDIKECDLFVLSSLYEGFATIINESLIAGTPVLTTNVSGTDEQITQKEYGWIVENTQEALNEGLYEALSHPEVLQQMKESLKGYHYDNELILKKFEEVL
ncbi:MAG: glycosyltransferase [Erysipelotrichaceae bacterium]|nr:glycosyltransferase [Erysipelotrichaceae bacterium]